MNALEQTKQKLWLVYEHIAPNGNRYIGITSNSLNLRSGVDGKNYLVKRKMEHIIILFLQMQY